MVNLVGYSSSEESENEATTPAPKLTLAPNPDPPQPPISAPQKTRIGSLPPLPVEEDKLEGPPTKRQRTGEGGIFSGLSSFLPAPKRSAGQIVAVAAAGGESSGDGNGRRAPFSLKTSHEAAFQRVEGTAESSAAADAALAKVLNKKRDAASPANTQSPGTATGGTSIKKPLMRPLSVQATKKKSRKKKIAPPASPPPASIEDKMDLDAEMDGTSDVQPAQKMKPKVSLFSTSSTEDTRSALTMKSGEYRPLLLDENEDEDDSGDENPEYPVLTDDDAYFVEPPTSTPNTIVSTAPAQSVDTLYATLSASERRQLFGRKGAADMSALSNMQVKNFNADAEYSANETLRANGEQQEVKAVRPINPGKHSLRQLVNVAVAQKDALEDSYARGATNKKEGASKYGW